MHQTIDYWGLVVTGLGVALTIVGLIGFIKTVCKPLDTQGPVTNALVIMSLFHALGLFVVFIFGLVLTWLSLKELLFIAH